MSAYNGKQPGDATKGAKVIVDVVRGEGQAAGKRMPAVLAIGSDCYQIVRSALEDAIDRLDTWKDVTISTDLPKDH